MRKALLALLAFAAALAHAAEPKVFRYAFEVAETSFDPHRISDVYSNIVNQAMFEAPLTYDYLARPLKLKPQTLESMPEISADGTMHRELVMKTDENGVKSEGKLVIDVSGAKAQSK